MIALLSWRTILVFAMMVFVDTLWTFYIRRTGQGKAFQAALASAGIMLMGGLVTLSYVDNKWFLLPAALGCFTGTLLTVYKDHKKPVAPKED